MPKGTIVTSESLYEGDPLPRPYVLKPINEGSSVGVAIVTDDCNYGSPIAGDAAGPWQEFETLLAEPFVGTRELTVAVLGDEALAVTELKPVRGFYDYDAKYTDGLTVHQCPADLPEAVTDGGDGTGADGAPCARVPRGSAGRIFATMTGRGLKGCGCSRSIRSRA